MTLDERLKTRAGAEDCPVPESYGQWFEERLEAVTAAKQKRTGPLRSAALAVGLAAALAVTVLAASPTLRETLAAALGGFAPYAQSLEGEAVDQGIRVRVVSVLADSYVVQVYAEVTDLTGDRLSNAQIGGNIDMELGEEHLSASQTDYLGYDPETKTVLLRYSYWAGAEICDQLPAVLKLRRIQPDYRQFLGEDIPISLLRPEELESEMLEGGQTVLIPGQTNYALEGPKAEGVILSSMGFAADGKLHLLFQFPDRAADMGFVLCTPYWTQARAEQEGKRLVPVSSAAGTRFRRNGTVYFDSVVDIIPADVPDIGSLAYPSGIFSTQETIKGTWDVPFVLTRMPETVSPLSGIIDHNTLQSLRLSPLGVVITSASDDWTQVDGYPLTVFFADGTVLRPGWGQIGGGADWAEHMARWEFEAPVEVDEITGIALGAWYIPVERGIAGEGHWLAQLP